MTKSSSVDPPSKSRNEGGKLEIRIPIIPSVLTYKKDVDADSAVGRLWQTTSPLGRGMAVVGLVLLVGLVGLGGWRYLQRSEPPPAQPPDLYAVRVVAVDPEGRPLDSTEIHASAGNEPQRVDGGWEVEIPRAKVPEDGSVTFRAEHPDTGGLGSAELVLGEDPTPSVTIPLTVTEASVRGIVVDSERRALAGVLVSVAGYGEEAVVTDSTGSFVVGAHRPRGDRVRLRAEPEGLPPVEQYCFAGSDQCQIVVRGE